MYFFSRGILICKICCEDEGILVANNCTTYVSVLFNPNAPVARDVGLIKGYAFNSGVVLVVILSVMIICALPFVRRRGSFEVSLGQNWV